MGHCKTTTHVFQQAMKQKEFKIVYQPKFDMQTERITGLEAFLCWNKPDGSAVSPGVFIPMAEDTGDITSFTLKKSKT